MKKPVINFSKSVSLDSQSGREFILSVQNAAEIYARACAKVGVLPDDVILSIFIERAKIEYRKF